MDRRSFITSLIGGFAVASLGGIAIAVAAPSATAPSPEPDADAALAAGKAEALDGTDAGYSQYSHRRRHHRYHHRHHGYRRPYRHRGRPDRRARPRSQR